MRGKKIRAKNKFEGRMRTEMKNKQKNPTKPTTRNHNNKKSHSKQTSKKPNQSTNTSALKGVLTTNNEVSRKETRRIGKYLWKLFLNSRQMVGMACMCLKAATLRSNKGIIDN